MFTGLIQEMGRVEAVEARAGGTTLRVEAPSIAPECRPGDSVAVNGCCLTVEEAAPPLLSFTAVPETLGRTTLSRLKAGDAVNLELPLRPSDRIGGHFVQGHVDGLAEVEDAKPEGEGMRLRVRLPEFLLPYVAEKGSIALDGVSLTVAALRGPRIEVALVPHTLRRTTLGVRKAGDLLNVEADVLARHVERLMRGLGLQDGRPV